MTDENSHFRTTAIELLELYCSSESILEYKKSVPIAHVQAELFCMWFDDFYHLTPSFKSAFTESELEALHNFHTFYDSCSNSLPPVDTPLESFIESLEWKKISEKARDTLSSFKDRQS